MSTTVENAGEKNPAQGRDAIGQWDGLGMSIGGGSKPAEQRGVSFLSSLTEKSKKNHDLSLRSAYLSERLRAPIALR